MNDQYHAPLALNVQLLNPHVKLESNARWVHGRLDIVNDMHPDLHEFFKQFNLKIVLVETFYSPPFFQSRPHSDSHGGDIGKINWIFGGLDSKMCWHHVKENRSRPNTGSDLSDISTEFMLYRFEDVELIYESEIHSPSIVQVGTPHSVATTDNERWCISLVLIDTTTNKQATYTKLLELFSEYRI